MRAFIVDPENTERFVETAQERPTPGPRDLLVRVEAVSANPVDTKVRRGRAGKVLGWDAAGEVVAVGEAVERFQVGDAVYYAGDVRRAGSNAELQLVDERLVGHRPSSLSAVEAAALPLTALTAWEGLFEQLQVQAGGTLLMINGAGGVGSMVIQMAKNAGLTVIATASRPETEAWVRELGADVVVSHRGDLAANVKAAGFESVNAIFCAHDTARHFEAMAALIAPMGAIVSIVETDDALPLGKLFGRRVRFSWELMFTRAIYQTEDMGRQGEILDEVAKQLDAGALRGTLTQTLPLSAEGLTEAHRILESGRSVGKLALSWGA
ncbi:MAG: zinc-binding alcohol dehydrogenase family protein [Alphaproteobacteria bacterium]|nr:zinc-binding alcohol dehydrogenase family protein [Alphaproteobacteria bacterium]MCB9792113.1 zinc-binding alcohol dehydrogenase family protein [Alphaproteobacteria bacterium]